MSFSLTGIPLFLAALFVVCVLGYTLGRITIKGINLGTAGVFLVAILFGIFFYTEFNLSLGGKARDYLKIVENLGLMLFVTSIGFIAGPTFFANLKKNFKSYFLLGLIIILMGGITAVACFWFATDFGTQNTAETAAMTAGLLSGALTSTPALSAAQSTVENIDPTLVSTVTVGNGIAYLFGVIGVVLFVQVIPLLERADIDKEREAIQAVSADTKPEKEKAPSFFFDSFGLMPFFFAALVGALIGRVMFGKFSLTTTGGCLLVSLLLGHFKKLGKVSILPPQSTLKVLRELGLMLFLMGAGIPGGSEFVAKFKIEYFFYGALMTLIPMIVGYFFAKYVLKLRLFNTLGSITGGMTSTPALGTLIHVAKTESVASAYAATYPIALIAVVIVSQAIILFFC